MSEGILFPLLRSSVAVAVAALIAATLLTLFRCRSPRVHRIAWALVVLQGILWVRIPVDIPVLTPQTPTPAHVVQSKVIPQEEFVAEPSVFPEIMEPILFETEMQQATTHELPTKSLMPHASRLMPLPAIWLSGLLGAILLRCIGWRCLKRQLKSAKPANEITQIELQLLYGKKTRLLFTENFGPAIFRRTILIPQPIWEDSSHAIRFGILKHELSHARHHDGLKSFALSLIAMVHWFNPLVWFAVKKFNDAAEWRCDSEAFGADKNGVVVFAESMLALSRNEPKYLAWVQSYKNHDIKERLKRLNEHHLTLKEPIMKKISILIIFCALFCFGLLKIQLVAQNPPTENAQSEKQQTEKHVNQSDDSKFTHLVTFRAKGDFNSPPHQFLSLFREKLAKEGSAMEHSRITVADGKLTGFICTDKPDALKRLIETIPEIESVKSERLTKEAFEAYKKNFDAKLSIPGVKYLVTFQTKDDFNSKNTPSLSKLINEARVGQVRMETVDGKGRFSLYTNEPDRLERLIKTFPEFEFVKTEQLANESVEENKKSPDGAPPALDWVEKNGKFYLKTQSGEIEAAPLSTAPLPKMDESNYTILSLDYRKVYILGAALEKMSEEEYRKLNPDFSSRYPTGGITVRKLTKGFRADDANLRPDDTIIGFDRYQMSTMDELSYFQKLKPKHDTKIKLWVLRADKLYYVDIPVEAMDVKPQDGGFVTGGPPGVSGLTHRVTFQPKGDFNPKDVRQFLFPLLDNDKIIKEGPITGYFRTKNVNGKLIGSLCTDDPDTLKRFIETVPQIEFVKSERLTRESFEAHEKSVNETLPPTDGGFETPGGAGISGFTHIVTWGPKGNFAPRTPRDYLKISHAQSDPQKIYRGYFRTKIVDGKLIASNLTNMPEELKKVIESTPEFEYISTERLTKESFEAYEKTPQESLPPASPTDGGFATPQGGFTHLITYGPKGDFVPRTPMDYLSLINPELWKTPINMGYFRTKIEDGKLIAMNLTSNPDEYRKVIESIPKFQYISTERLTQESFGAYENTQQVSLPPEDGGYATDAGYTHIVTFAPQGDFAPKTVSELLGVITFAKMHEYATQLGYFRTKPVDGKLIGSFLTSTPDKFEKLVDSIPNVKFLSAERLTQEKFEAYEKSPQLSLPNPELEKRLDEIQKTAWFQNLNEKQKREYMSAERSFPFVFDPKNYEVGDVRDEFEKKWVERLEGPEPGFPGRSQLSPYDEAILGLATIKSKKAAKLLTKIACEQVVKDNAHRCFAVRALGMLGDASVVPDLIPLLYHYNVNCRWEAQIALVRLTGENFGGDEHAWIEWYNANRGKLGQNLPKLDSTPIDWTCGSNDPDMKKWADREEQKKRDER